MSQQRNIALSVGTRVVTCIVVLALAGGIFIGLVVTRPVAESVRSAGPPRVLVVQPQRIPVRREWSGYGTAAAMDAADVPARVSATVAEVPPEVLAGAPVARGQLLARLDDSDFIREVEIAVQTIAELDAQLAQLAVEEESWGQRLELALEEVALARTELERVQAAVEREAAKLRELDLARQALLAIERQEVATREEVGKVPARRLRLQALRAREEATLALARLNKQRCLVASPIDGLLQSIDVDEGESVQVGARVARVVSLARIEVSLRLPASARSSVRPGDEVSLSAGDRDEGGWRALVSRLSPEDDEATRTFGVFVELRQPGNAPLLAPGRFVRGVVRSDRPEARTVIPRRSVSGERILLVEDGILASRRVTVDFFVEGTLPGTGLEDLQWAVLDGDLPEGAAVLLNASSDLPVGGPVIAVPTAPGGPEGVVETGATAAEAGSTW